MTSLLHLAGALEVLATTVTTLWAMASEVLTAALLLAALNTLANAIRATYSAGRLAGRLLWPVIHAAAAAGRWLWANTDWAEVWAVLRASSTALVALAVTAAQLALPALCAASERLGKAYAALLVGTTTPQQDRAIPVQTHRAAAPVAVTKPTAIRRSHRPTKAAPKRPQPSPVDLSGLRVTELRQLARKAGHKALARSGRKADLLAALAA